MHRVLLPFEFAEPVTVAEAVGLIDGDRSRALAGGVDLVLKMRLRQVEQSAAVLQGWPLLAEAIASIVSVQTKVMGTAVGNLCVGTPASDVAPALYALGARMRIAGCDGDREIPIESFFLDAGKTAVRPHEIVTEIVVPAPAADSAGAFLKLAKTSEDIAKVNVAVTLAMNGGRCTYARIAVGSAAPTPLRAVGAEEALVGRPLDAAVVADAAQAAADAVCPISDVRSTAAYRTEMVRVLVRDALMKAAARAAGKGE
jgi:carbon-monoxide dehydrogenase medium subunit